MTGKARYARVYSLDVLDYLTELEDHLETRFGKPERKMARKEVKRLVEDFSFRFASMDGRAMPEDVDHVRALECLKPPAKVAELMERRRPVYHKRKVRARMTRGLVLAFLVLFGVAFAQFAASEDGDVVLDYSYFVGNAETKDFADRVDTFTFNVTEADTRILLATSITVSQGNVTLTLLSPEGEQAYVHTFQPRQGNYERKELLDPAPGEWTLDVKHERAVAYVELWAQTVRPAS